MADKLSGAELLSQIVAISEAHGVKPASSGPRVLTGAQEAIKSKWFLGGRKVTYKMQCELDEPGANVRFREATVESSWGFPPPALTVEKTSQRGTRVSESRSDRGAGGGQLDYGRLREAVEQAVRGAGWRFEFEAGWRP